jgi:transposase
MASYSQDLRDRVLRGLERGEGPTAIAQRLEVTRGWVYQVKKRFEELGERCSHQVGGYRRSRVEGKEEQLRKWIKAQPDLTLEQLCELLAGQGVMIKSPALWHQLDKWGLTYKKNRSRQRARASGREGRENSVEGRSARS